MIASDNYHHKMSNIYGGNNESVNMFSSCNTDFVNITPLVFGNTNGNARNSWKTQPEEKGEFGKASYHSTQELMGPNHFSFVDITSSALASSIRTNKGSDVNAKAEQLEKIISSENEVFSSENDMFPPTMGDKSTRSGAKGDKKMRKQRYAFHTKSQVDILDDGYRWRKYGQKAVKNNLFPRSYYRCTHQSCKVKKQVQRLSEDRSTVVTTYEGVHTHPYEKSNDNFDHILRQLQFGPNFI